MFVKRHSVVIPILLFVATFTQYSSALAEEFNGGFGLQHATSARTFMARTWSVQSYSNFYAVDPGAGMETNATAAVGVNYGVGYNIELEATSVLYQDYIRGQEVGVGYIGSESPILNDVFLRWKWGNQRLFGDFPIVFGMQGTIRYKLGDYYNRFLAVYYDSPGTTAQLNFLFSYYRNLDDPFNSFQFHYNFGYINFNDAETITESADAIRAFWGMRIPLVGLTSALESWDYLLEGRAIYYNNYPADLHSVFATENNAYLTSSLDWQFANSWSFTAGVDFKVFEDEYDYTDSDLYDTRFPDFPTWRLTYQLSYTPNLGMGGYGRGSGFGGFRGQGQGRGGYYPPPGAYGRANRGALYDWGGSIRDDIEYMEIELDKIREERKEAEEKLRNLKEKVQKKKSGN